MLLVILHSVGLDLADAFEHIVEQRREHAQLCLGLRRNAAQAPAEINNRQQTDREDDEGHRCQDPVGVEHDADQDDDGQQVADRAGDRLDYRFAQEIDVVGETGNQLAGRVAVQESQIGADDAVEHLALQCRDDAQSDPVHQHGLSVTAEALDDRDGQEGERDQPDQIFVARDQNPVERRLDQPRLSAGGGGNDDHADDR